MSTVSEGMGLRRGPELDAPEFGPSGRSREEAEVLDTPRHPGRSLSLRSALALGDLLVVAGAWALGGFLAGNLTPRQRSVGAALAVVVTVAALSRGGMYRARLCARASDVIPRIVVSCALGGLVFAGYEWADTATDWTAPAAGGLAATLGLLVARWRFDRRLRVQRAAGRHVRPVILVGIDGDAVALSRMLADEPELGYRVVAIVGSPGSEPSWSTLAYTDRVGELPRWPRRVGATGVLIVGNATVPDRRQVVELAVGAGLHVQIWPGLWGLSHRRVRLAPVARLPMLYVEPNPVGRWQFVTKRVLDVTAAVVLLPLFAPVLLVAAAWIKLEDGGPVFHHHNVIGRLGKPMTVLKLRTMVPNAEEMLVDITELNERTGGPLFKATRDPRVTQGGRFLRASSIDELPQLFNVLVGSMSLIGPRFSLPDEEAQFDEEHRRRHAMRPGITGLWQSDARDNPSFSAYRRLDLFYVDNWSLTLDLAIAANTVHAVATRGVRALLGTERSRPPLASPSQPGDTSGRGR